MSTYVPDAVYAMALYRGIEAIVFTKGIGMPNMKIYVMHRAVHACCLFVVVKNHGLWELYPVKGAYQMEC